MVDVSSVLQVLADLAPDRREPSFEVPTSGATPLAWLGASPTGDDPFPSNIYNPDQVAFRVEASASIDALARYDALTPDADDLRIGWAWAAGTTTYQGEQRRFLLPLLSRPVAIMARGQLARMVWSRGPWDLWPLVDEARAPVLERAAQFGGGALWPHTPDAMIARFSYLHAWIDDVLRASHHHDERCTIGAHGRTDGRFSGWTGPAYPPRLRVVRIGHRGPATPPGHAEHMGALRQHGVDRVRRHVPALGARGRRA